MAFSCYLDSRDYSAVRIASMRGKFSHDFYREVDGDTFFTTKNRKVLCRDLERIIDFGATTADEVLTE